MNNTLEKIKKGFIWFLKSYVWVIILLIGIDALTKWMFEIYLPTGRVTVIPNFFYFELIHNTGAGWGAFAGQKALLVSISTIAGIAMVGILIWKYNKLNKWYKVALYLMIAGDFGNLIDRAFYKNGVIDFIKFVFGSYNFPTFNLADSYLVIGCIILLIAILIEDRKENKSTKKADESVIQENLEKANLVNNDSSNKENNQDLPENSSNKDDTNKHE